MFFSVVRLHPSFFARFFGSFAPLRETSKKYDSVFFLSGTQVGFIPKPKIAQRQFIDKNT
jgi:hypothetical protein